MIKHMGERPTFGVDKAERVRQAKPSQPASMFSDGEELPLFSGTPIPAIERPFEAQDHSMKQVMLPEMPPIDYDHVLEKDRALRRRRSPAALPPAEDIFTAAVTTPSEPPAEVITPAAHQERAIVPVARGAQERQRAARGRTEKLHPLREALAPYLDFPTLRRLAAQGEDLSQAYIGTGEMPTEIQAVLDALALMLRPVRRETVRSPADVAAVFMIEMEYLDQ